MQMPTRRSGVPAAEALRVYRECGNNASEAARRLRMNRGTIRRIVKEARAGLAAPSGPEGKRDTQSPTEHVLLVLQKAIKDEAFRQRVEGLWREDSERLMSEVTRLHDAAR